MTTNFWDNVFNQEEYVYGTEPNEFFKEVINKLKPGNIILPGEGEGRNAFYALKNEWKVDAIDGSIKAIQKAKLLTQEFSQNITFKHSDLLKINLEENHFDAAGIIFVHFDESNRKLFHSNINRSIKEGGALIMQVFSKDQIKNNTGGPSNIDMLYSEVDLLMDFMNFRNLMIEKKEITFAEGERHNGRASVINVFGIK